MIVTEGRLCRVGTVHFDEEPPATAGLDIVRFVQRRTPVPGAICAPYFTMVLDLRRDAETMLAAMNKGMRKDLRNGEKKGLTYRAWHGDPAVVEEACAFYDRFAASKGIPLADRVTLDRYAAEKRLRVSSIASGDETLVWHVYYTWRHRAVSLYSASFYRAQSDPARRALVGVANRYHKWRDILTFKDAGFTVFDFGGWYEGTTDPDRLRINKFKEDFAGVVERNWNCELPVTLKGHVALAARRLPALTAAVRDFATRRFAPRTTAPAPTS
jgi:hypothetical protein